MYQELNLGLVSLYRDLEGDFYFSRMNDGKNRTCWTNQEGAKRMFFLDAEMHRMGVPGWVDSTKFPLTAQVLG